MIISHKYKFLFIGLPFSASSAISKDLHLKYDGEPRLSKHSLYREFKKTANKEELGYFKFAVLRNPMEMAVTIYEKMKNNSKGNFTNPNLFSENGGHITKNHQKKYKYIHEKSASFQQFFLKHYKYPYDNLASQTLQYCDYIIRYENIQEDYLKALKKAGVKKPKSLPVANKTTGKKSLDYYFTEETIARAVYVFGPFMKKYNFKFPDSWVKFKVPLSSIILFKIFSLARKINQNYFKKTTEKIGLKDTIYGDMQKGRLKD